jgi:hypothetical protein
MTSERDELARLIDGLASLNDGGCWWSKNASLAKADRIIAAGYRRPSPAADEQEAVEAATDAAMASLYGDDWNSNTVMCGRMRESMGNAVRAALRALNRGPRETDAIQGAEAMSEQQERDELARIAGEALLKLATVEAERDAALKEVERLRADNEQGGKDYLALMDRHDAQHVQIAALTARLKEVEEAGAAVVRDYPVAAFGALTAGYTDGYGSIRRLAEGLGITRSAALTPPATETKE